MNIVIFGAGYVGTVTGGCLVKSGHRVTFIEPNSTKVMHINSGESPIYEPDLNELIAEGRDNCRLQAKTEVENEILEADIAMIAVPTPSLFNGEIDLSYIRKVLFFLKSHVEESRTSSLPVVFRSTIHPKALRDLKKEFSSEKLEFISNPEFLRESTAVYDFFNPPYTVVGGDDQEAMQKVASLYEGPCYLVSLETACLLKYACNAFHALKISFANEMGTLCSSMNVNATEVMELFCQDTKLNCSKAYLKPGFSFGGSCLPKDLKSLVHLSQQHGLHLPLISSILPSNDHRFQRILHKILEGDHERIAILGMSFKKNSDDLRESPFIKLIESLHGRGINLSLYDPDVKIENLTGTNLKQFRQRYGHLIPLIKHDIESALAGCDGVVLCKDFLTVDIIERLCEKGVVTYDINHLYAKRDEPIIK